MLIMAEVTAEMGAELRASAMAAGTSVAAEVGRRLERLQRVEAEDRGDQMAAGWGLLDEMMARGHGPKTPPLGIRRKLEAK
jgi:hypothetical protein